MKALVLKTNLIRPKNREISNILGLQNLYTGNLFLDYAIRLIIFLLFFGPSLKILTNVRAQTQTTTTLVSDRVLVRHLHLRRIL